MPARGVAACDRPHLGCVNLELELEWLVSVLSNLELEPSWFYSHFGFDIEIILLSVLID